MEEARKERRNIVSLALVNNFEYQKMLKLAIEFSFISRFSIMQAPVCMCVCEKVEILAVLN